MCRQKAEQKYFENLNFGLKKTVCKVGTKRRVIAEKIRAIRKKLSTSNWKQKKDVLRASQESKILYELQGKRCKRVNFSFEKSVSAQ